MRASLWETLTKPETAKNLGLCMILLALTLTLLLDGEWDRLLFLVMGVALGAAWALGAA